MAKFTPSKNGVKMNFLTFVFAQKVTKKWSNSTKNGQKRHKTIKKWYFGSHGINFASIFGLLVLNSHQKIARKFLKSGDVQAARKTYLKTRTWVRGTVAFFEVSLWLAQLEYSQGRFAEARQFAAEAGRSRDQSIQKKAREVVARVREDQSQSDSVPASTE